MLDEIHIRLRQEIDRSGLSLAAASRAAGEPSPQRLKDMVSGRQKCTAEVLAKLISIGVDSSYVLTGRRSEAANSPEEVRLLESFRAADILVKDAVLRALNSASERE